MVCVNLIKLKKTCKACKRFLFLVCFCKSKKGKWGRASVCRVCTSPYRKNLVLKNKGKKVQKRVLSSCVSLIKTTDLFKPCGRCKGVLSVRDFSPCAGGKYGRASFCYGCRSRRWKEHGYEAEKDNRVFYQKTHKEEIKEWHTQYFQENKTELSKKNRDWALSHPERVSEIALGRFHERYDNDPPFCLAHILRNRVKGGLKGKTEKTGRTKDLVGCSVEKVWERLRTTYWPGMNDGNRGGKTGWQIDHIIPISAVDITDPVMQKLVFHYTNTQALWRGDNAKKHGFIPTFLVQPIPFCGTMIAVALDENNRVAVKCFK